MSSGTLDSGFESSWGFIMPVFLPWVDAGHLLIFQFAFHQNASLFKTDGREFVRVQEPLPVLTAPTTGRETFTNEHDLEGRVYALEVKKRYL